MKLAVFGRMTERTDLSILEGFFEFLQQREVSYSVHFAYARELMGKRSQLDKLIGEHIFTDRNTLGSFDFAYSFGGDGTLLNTVEYIGSHATPILGVNFGRLGFLTTIMSEGLHAATFEVINGMHKIDARVAMTVESEPKGLFGSSNFGLNDLTIHKSSTNEMITVHTYLNGEFLNSYWGDGLIVATPTGSTAYSLSCGGPIIHPNANSFAITPVAPHSLTVRPIIVPDHYVLSFEIESRAGEAMVAIDTRTELVNARTEIAIRKADFPVNLVRVSTANYLNTLRNRLMWGKDRRN